MPQACNRQTAYCVPLYDTLGPDAVEYIIGHAEVTIVFASALKMRALVEPLSRAKGKVKAVIVWGEIDGIAKMVSSPASCESMVQHLLGSSEGVRALPLHFYPYQSHKREVQAECDCQRLWYRLPLLHHRKSVVWSFACSHGWRN